MKSVIKIIGSFFLILFFLLIQTNYCFSKEKFVLNINPVRGNDFWTLTGQKPNDFIKAQKEISKNIGSPANWLIRPDYFLNADKNLFLESDFQNDELGIFLEVTPSWAEKVGVFYNKDLPWYHSQNVFLSGYNPKDRIKLIDYAFLEFKKIYGFYPKSVGAWHIDSLSSDYLVKAYGVKTFLICTDQTSTDGYQIWGGWWGIPYYPSKDNLLVPAQTKNDKLDALVLWWAARDPVNGYGEGKSSLYSVQANDYLQNDLDTNYFHKLTDIYLNQTSADFGQITVGLENDNYLTLLKEYKNQIEDLKKSNALFIKSIDFYNWYSSINHNLSPDVEITGNDPLNNYNEFKWILTKNNRIALINKNNSDWTLIDYRIYSKDNIDPYKYYKNLGNKLYWNIPAKIDSVLGVGETTTWSNDSISKSISSKNNHFFQISAIILFTIVLFMNIFKKIKFFPSLIILLGTAVISLTMVRSGSQYPYGIGFWGPNGHDGIWHLSLINQLQNSIPPKNPVYSGSILSNYHWGFDFLAAVISKVSFLPNVFVYFKLMPVLFGLLIGVLSYLIALNLTKDKKTSFFFVFLNYFAGSLGWVVTLIREGKIGGESLFWSMQSASVLLNPPYALSLIILLSGLLFWIKYRKANKIYLALINGLIFGILAGVKVYAGILIGLALASFWLINYLKTKKFFNYHFWICLSTALFSFLILFFLGAYKSSTLLEFKPLWFTHSMIESIDKLYLPRLASLRLNLSQSQEIIKLPVLIFIELFLIGIFLVGNMGFRTLGFLTAFKKIKGKKIKEFDILILVLMLFAFIIPMLFVQKGTAWNTIQFFYYFLFFSNLFFAQFLSSLIKNKKNKTYLLTALLIIFTIPTSYSTIKDYLGNPPPAAIPSKEIEAINYLKNQNKGIILSYPFDKYKKDYYKISTPIPVYLYETTSYISAFSGHQSFLEDEMNLDITGFDWQTRRKEIEKFFSTTDKYFARGFLLNNNIDYIYLVNDQEFKLSDNDLQIDKVFDNSQVTIYKVRK